MIFKVFFKSETSWILEKMALIMENMNIFIYSLFQRNLYQSEPFTVNYHQKSNPQK